METKKLRQKILDLAIRGKLVPQDPNDEPASVLLERIKAEKEQLIKAGKIKRGKKSASSDTFPYENVPFEIPESWVWTTLEEICLFLSRGKSPKYSNTDKTYPVFAQKCNLKGGGISLEQARFLDPSTICKWGEEYKLKTGDVLVNSTGTGTVGRTRLFHESCLKEYPFVVPDSHVSVIRTISEIKSEFVYAYISSQLIQQYLEDNLAGSTNQKELYIGILSDLSFPIPPIAEQQRIVAEIEKWFAWIDQIEHSKADLQTTIKQTKSKILNLAIHGKLVPQDPNDEPAIDLLRRINPDFKPCDNAHYKNLPEGWSICKLSDVCEFERGITFPASAKTYLSKNKIACIRTANIQEQLETEDLWYIDEVYLKGNNNKIVRCNDILMSSANSRELVGKTSYITNLVEPMTFGGFIMALRSKIGSAQFLFILLRALFFSGYLSSIASQTTNIANLSSKTLGDIKILFPPKAEQERIVQTVTDLFNKLDKIIAEL